MDKMDMLLKIIGKIVVIK